jgi:hypothetical protein
MAAKAKIGEHGGYATQVSMQLLHDWALTHRMHAYTHERMHADADTDETATAAVGTAACNTTVPNATHEHMMHEHMMHEHMLYGQIPTDWLTVCNGCQCGVAAVWRIQNTFGSF